MRLNRYLAKHVPLLSGGEMYRALRIKRIKVNGKRAEASLRLAPGDTVDVYLNDSYFSAPPKQRDFMNASRSLTIVYEDDNIALLYKPAGVLVHADKSEYSDNLINRYLLHLYNEGKYDPDSDSFVPALCNRLDRGTAGLVLVAKNAEALAEADYIIKERLVSKYYLCVTVSHPPKDGIYYAYLRKNEKTNQVEVTDTPLKGSKPIRTGFETIASNGGLWLVEVNLITGRPHQIRAHLAHLGAPILGDEKYGVPRINKKYDVRRQALCAYKMVFHRKLEGVSKLSYLAGRSFELEDVWFRDQYFGS